MPKFDGTKDVTWEAVRDYLNSLDPDNPILEQKLEIFPYTTNYDEPVHLLPVIGIDTVKAYCDTDKNGTPEFETRSAYGFDHKPELLVLLTDSSPYDKEGNSFWTMRDDGALVGNRTGKVIENPFPKKDFYTSVIGVKVKVSHQFGPDSALNMIATSLNYPAIQGVDFTKIVTNYKLHGEPTEDFHEMKITSDNGRITTSERS